jgi:hypothetical protein
MIRHRIVTHVSFRVILGLFFELALKMEFLSWHLFSECTEYEACLVVIMKCTRFVDGSTLTVRPCTRCVHFQTGNFMCWLIRMNHISS